MKPPSSSSSARSGAWITPSRDEVDDDDERSCAILLDQDRVGCEGGGQRMRHGCVPSTEVVRRPYRGPAKVRGRRDCPRRPAAEPKRSPTIPCRGIRADSLASAQSPAQSAGSVRRAADGFLGAEDLHPPTRAGHSGRDTTRLLPVAGHGLGQPSLGLDAPPGHPGRPVAVCAEQPVLIQSGQGSGQVTVRRAAAPRRRRPRRPPGRLGAVRCRRRAARRRARHRDGAGVDRKPPGMSAGTSLGSSTWPDGFGPVFSGARGGPRCSRDGRPSLPDWSGWSKSSPVAVGRRWSCAVWPGSARPPCSRPRVQPPARSESRCCRSPASRPRPIWRSRAYTIC